MFYALALVTTAMTGAGESGPVCSERESCNEAWRATVGGVEVRIVERHTADARAAEREASESIYVHGAAGWLETDVSWSMLDIEMSTVRSTFIAHRRVRIGSLADRHPVVLLQIDLRDEVHDRGPPKLSTTESKTLLVACMVDRVAPACTSVIWLNCAGRCEEAHLRTGVLTWSDDDGDHRESLAFPLPSARAGRRGDRDRRPACRNGRRASRL